jgi:hypothetical protein
VEDGRFQRSISGNGLRGSVSGRAHIRLHGITEHQAPLPGPSPRIDLERRRRRGQDLLPGRAPVFGGRIGLADKIEVGAPYLGGDPLHHGV